MDLYASMYTVLNIHCTYTYVFTPITLCVCTGQCISYLYISAFTSNLLHSQSNTDHNVSLLAKGVESTIKLPDLPKGKFQQGEGDLWKLSIETDFNITTCITLDDIQSISLVAASDDGWNIGSITTFAVVSSDCKKLITADYDVNRWVDGDGDDEHLEFALSLLTAAGPCINYLFVDAHTSDVVHDHTQADVSHTVELKADGLTKTTPLADLPDESRGNLWKLSLVDDFGFATCIRKKDIQGIAIVAGDTDGWNIDSIFTYVAANEHCRQLSSFDCDVDKWIDQNSFTGHKRFDLSLVI